MKFLIILAMSLSLFGLGDKNGKKPEGPFKYYEYRSTTMREYPREYYRLEYTEENGLTLSWSKSNSPVKVVPVPEKTAEDLRALILEYELYKLKPSYMPPGDVRDGIMWHIYFCFGENKTSCSADNAWPKDKLLEGIKAVNAFFNQFIEEAPED